MDSLSCIFEFSLLLFFLGRICLLYVLFSLACRKFDIPKFLLYPWFRPDWEDMCTAMTMTIIVMTMIICIGWEEMGMGMGMVMDVVGISKVGT